MSIINQALKKAQREQLWHGSALPSPVLLPHVSRQRQQRRPRRVLYLALALGAGICFIIIWTRKDVANQPVLVSPPAVPSIPSLAAQPASPSLPPAPASPLPGTSSQVAMAEAPLRSSSGPASSPAGQTASPSLPQTAKGVELTGATSASPARLPVPRPKSLPPREKTTRADVPRTKTLLESQPEAKREARALYNRAIQALQGGERQHARMLLQRALTLDPALKEAYTNLGNLYYQQRHYQRAIAMYKQALALDPTYVKARNNLGSAYLRLAMHQQAIEEFEKVLQADGTFSLAYYNLACVYARMGNSARAAHYLRQAIALEPEARRWAQSDEDFRPVRTALEVQKLLRP